MQERTKGDPLSNDSLAATPLHSRHTALGAKMGPFAGYDMPIVYAGIAAEHAAVRAGCGVFDVSHMGRIRFTGTAGVDAVQRLTTIHLPSVETGSARYGLVLNDDAGVIDDVIAYRLTDDDWMLVVNASNRVAVLERAEHLGVRDPLVDETEVTGMLAIQGPAARDVLLKAAPSLRIPEYSMRVVETSLNGVPVDVATTGYTGEDGVEVVTRANDIGGVWDALIDCGATPAGLGARDTLRLEVGYPLHGHELAPDIRPAEARAAWAVNLRNDVFAGRDAFLATRDEPISRRLVGIRTSGRGVPRADQVVACGGAEVGRVTSGTFSPTLGTGIALAFVAAEHAETGTPVSVGQRATGVARGNPRRAVEGEIVALPFYRDGSRRPNGG